MRHKGTIEWSVRVPIGIRQRAQSSDGRIGRSTMVESMRWADQDRTIASIRGGILVEAKFIAVALLETRLFATERVVTDVSSPERTEFLSLVKLLTICFLHAVLLLPVWFLDRWRCCRGTMHSLPMRRF
jgi:hypothetical protein